CQTGLLAVPEALGTMLQVVTEGVKRRHPKQPATLDIDKQERGKFFSNILHACKYQVPASSMGAGTLHAQCVNAGIPFYIPCGPTRVVTVTSFGGVSQLRLAASTTLLVMVFSCPQQAAVGYAGTGWLGTCQNSGPLGWLALRRQCVSSRSGSGCR